MKKFTVILSVLISSISLAQEEMFANEGSGTFQNNPASFGNQEIWSVNTFGQIRFTEFYGAPGSLNVNSGGVISFSEKGKHQLIVGGSYSNNKDYFANDMTSRLSLGYKLIWNKNSSISIALGPGFSDLQYNLYHISANANGDVIYFTEENHGRSFDMSVGTMFNWKTLYAGVSITHLNSPVVGAVPVELAPTYNMQAGYKIPVKGHFIFPVAQLQHVDGFTSYQFMTNYVFKKDLFSVGLGYRLGGNLLLGASCELKGIRIGYSYNTLRSRLTSESSGAHELRLSYIVKSKNAER
jgi:type IX secretion system PorP/SprF family membrane protein